MNLVLVSPFWNAEKFLPKYITSLKNQKYTNFVSYLIDDMSTDNSYEIAKKLIGDDERFILIKNTRKKFKTENFVDTIRNNDNIDDWDVIIEIDGDDMLSDDFVLGRINKIYQDPNIWIVGFKWVDQYGKSMKYGKANADSPRTSPWNFSHMRTYRSFLFRGIRDEDLRMNGEYFKAAVDLGMGMPMLEMAGNEHYRFFDEVMYIYHWHDHQSYSENSAMGDKKIQGQTAKYIYTKLPRYKKLSVPKIDFGYSSFYSDQKFYDYSEQNKLEIISKLTLKRQTIKPIIQESKNSQPEKKEYVVVDNTPAINNIITKIINNTPSQDIEQKTIVVNTPIQKNDNQKKLINDKRTQLINQQQKIVPDGFKKKQPFKKGNMNRRGGSFDF